MATAGIFWLHRTRPSPAWVLSRDVASLLTSRETATSFDANWLRSFHLRDGSLNFRRTPFHGINYLPPGTTATFWYSGSPPTVLSWFDRNPPTTLTDANDVLAQYRETFDHVVDSLITDDPTFATLSSGLDSSFVVASLAKNEQLSSPVQAFCHSPHPLAPLSAKMAPYHDEFAAAQAMVRMYPGRIDLHRVFPDPGANPLDAAATVSERSWLPVSNPANTIWIEAIGQAAKSMGASEIFVGSWGNYSFSSPHSYAAGFYLKQLRIRMAWRTARLQDPNSPVSALFYLPKAHTAQRLRRRSSNYYRYMGLRKKGGYRTPFLNRERFMEGLSPESAAATDGPDAWGIKPVDPFRHPAMINLAASITPYEWSRGPGHRGYARLLGENRIPDAIRLRQRKGRQSADQWYLIHNMRDRYYDELAQIPDTPVLEDLVDQSTLRRTLNSLPWGEPGCDDLIPVIAVNRIFSLAAYIRMTDKRLEKLARDIERPSHQSE